MSTIKVLETLGGFMHGLKHQFKRTTLVRVYVLVQTRRMVRAQCFLDAATVPTRDDSDHQHESTSGFK